MAGKVKVPVAPNTVVDGTRIEFKPISEPWCEFECEDGTRLRVKLVVTEVIKLEGQRTPEGDPVYVIRSSNIVHASVPDELKDGAGAKAASESQDKGGHYL